MTAPEPNEAQRTLIDGTEGVYHVDAGAGTGKTLAVTRRYANIIDQPGVEPEDVLLVTFTRSAATEMKERIVEHSSYGLRELADAPIRTFHAHCHTILQEHGYDAPTHLGIDDRITGSTRLIEDELVEAERFEEFIGQFQDAHPEYIDQFRAIDDPGSLLGLLKQLAAKGIFPTVDGWYRDSESHLDGDWDAFRTAFDELNQPRNDGRKQSALRAKLGDYGNKTYLPGAPSKPELRGGRGTKQVEPSVATQVFEADRADLKAFVHDVYVAYLEFALERNFLNFGFLQLFAYVVLMEDHHLREQRSFEYVMVDEFQDTSEIQFALALLLAGTENLCVVGDWKQSIYSFQYADVENIVEFEDRLDRSSRALNDDAERVTVPTEDITRIEFEENYRSTQTLLDFAEHALVAPATDGEAVDESTLDRVVSLSSNADFDKTTIEAIQHEDQHEAVLAKIQEIVGNEAYPVGDEDGNPRPPDYGDITVLTRTRDFGRELLQVAEAADFPMAYDGGIELFRTDPAKLLLAWLRILESDADRGWAVVLEQAGYAQEQMAHVLASEAYPSNMASFRAELAELESVASVARRVFDRYGFDGEYADVILDTVQSVHDTTTLTRGDLIRFVTRAIESGATHEVHTSAGEDAVTVQTIHAAKGLEYPIVVLANMNEGKFPPRSRNTDIVRYDESVGLRQRKLYAEAGAHPHVYDDWRYDVFRHCLPDAYDEERRLLYVAVTRAKHHMIFAGGEEPNAFLEGLPVDIEPGTVDVSPVERGETTQAQLPFTISPPEGPIGLTPHHLMDESVFDSDEVEFEAAQDGGRGFGSEVHDFAEAYARGEAVEPSNGHEDHIVEFLDGLDGELFVEEKALLPLEVDGTRVTVSGLVDLVCVRPDHVEIVDFKTDTSRRAEDEYRTQLSTYYHVLQSAYPGKHVTASLYYTRNGTRVTLDPLPIKAIEDLVRDILRGRVDH